MPPNDESRPLVFLSYAKEDAPRVRAIYHALRLRHVRIWFDETDTRPGAWRIQISKAIARSRYFLILLSHAALRKTGDEPGFQDQELNEAYQIAMNQSPHAFAIVPARIEDCGRGDNRLGVFNQYDLFPAPDLEDRLDSLALALGGTCRDSARVRAREERSEDERFLTRLLSRAETAMYANEPDRALEGVATILCIDDKLAAAHHLKASILEASGKLTEALESYTMAVASDPDYALAYNNRGFLHMSMGYLDSARKDFDRSIDLDPTEPIVYMNRATAFGAQGSVGPALQDMDRAVALDPGRPILYKTRAEIRHHVGKDPASAIADFDQAIRLSPEYRDAYFKRAVAREDVGDLEGAISDYSKALAIEESAVALANRALVYHQLGSNDLAVSDLECALELDPDDEVSRQNLVNIQTMIGVGEFFAQFPELSQKFSLGTRLRMGIDKKEDKGE